MKNLRFFDEYETIDGFNFKPGFVMWVDGETKCASSGWESGGAMMVYRQGENGQWTGEWEYPENNPDISALKEIWQTLEINECIKRRNELIDEGCLIHDSDTTISFSYSEEYFPTNQFGIYEIPSNADGCRNSFSVLTEYDYQKNLKESDLMKCDDIEKSGDFEFIRCYDNIVEIENYKGSSENLIIPETLSIQTEDGLEEFVVGSIGQGAFINPNIKTVVIPSCVERIEEGAFIGCVNLQKVTFTNPQNCDLKYIGDYAFAETNIESFQFPPYVNTLGDNVLAGNKNLRSVCISNGFTDYVSNIVGVGTENADITLVDPRNIKADNEKQTVESNCGSTIISPMVKGTENTPDTSAKKAQGQQPPKKIRK